MKTNPFLACNFALGTLLVSSIAVANDATSAVDLKSESQILSYTIGADLGSNFKEHQDLIAIDPTIVLKGMEDGLAGRKLILEKEKMTEAIQGFQKKIMAKRQKEFLDKAAANKKKSDEFLAENKKKKGVKITESGLQYKIIEEGKGASPGNNDEVKVAYTGKLLDGTVFDSSEKLEDKAVQFKVSEVIAGWNEALKLMKPGAKWTVFVPPSLAYGETGVGEPIGPNETLIFDIELKAVQPQKDEKETAS